MPPALAIIATAALAFSPVAAGAERFDFDSAARDSRVEQVFEGNARLTDRIYADLQLPSRGIGPFPAMVIMHSSRGIVPGILDWAKLFNEMGIATFVVDSFTPRGLTEASAGQLTFAAGVVDSLLALKALRRDPRIDSGNIGVIGFSRGAMAAMGSTFERYRAAVLAPDAAQFSLHIVFYGGCAQYAKTTGAPVLLFVGTGDDFINPALCRKNAEILNQQGTRAELVVYEGALHGFDTDFPRESMPRIRNYRNCVMLQDLDTFDAVLLDGRKLNAEERTSYARGCAGYGASRGGDRRHADAARERVRRFVAAQFRN